MEDCEGVRTGSTGDDDCCKVWEVVDGDVDSMGSADAGVLE